MKELWLAVCDDTAQDREAICSLLEQYGRGLEAHVRCYESAPALLAALAGGRRFDLYLLDVLMPEETGIALAREIRALDQEAAIIYLTSSPDYALDAFSVHAQRYLLKPVQRAELFEALDAARALLGRRAAPGFPVKTKRGVVNLPPWDILFVENRNRALCFHLAGGGQVCSSYLRVAFEQAVAPLLESGGFVQCHKSFVVNLAWVRAVTTVEFTLENGETVPISRNNASSARKAYLRYILQAEGQ